jgi:hypothetical protein
MRHGRLWLALAAGVVLAPAARGQFAKPGPEHDGLKELVGTWDATVKGPGGESKGVMTYKMDLGGLWLVGNFAGEMAGEKFTGKGLDSYDAASKKYVSVWVDSMVTKPLVMEGTMDKETHTLTMTGDATGMDGKPVKFKMVTHFKDKDTMVSTMSAGKDEMMTITYKRRK